jgi:hypothetical protein
MKKYPLIGHDFTELRRRSLSELATQYEEESYVDQAIEVISLLLYSLRIYISIESLSCTNLDSSHWS